MTISRIKGFTLIELLVVIVIIGVMVAVVGQNLGAGTAATRLRTATRGLMQMSRYARTMALLHQQEVQLTVASDGILSVKGKPKEGQDAFVSSSAFAAEAINTSAPDAEGNIPGADEEKQPGDEPAAPDSAPEETDAASTNSTSTFSSMADLDFQKKYDHISFVFEGYTDSFDEGGSGFGQKLRNTIHGQIQGEDQPSDNADEQTRDTIKYASNGTCRPCSIKVTTDKDDPDADSLTVVIDRLGSAKVEEDEEERGN